MRGHRQRAEADLPHETRAGAPLEWQLKLQAFVRTCNETFRTWLSERSIWDLIINCEMDEEDGENPADSICVNAGFMETLETEEELESLIQLIDLALKLLPQQRRSQQPTEPTRPLVGRWHGRKLAAAAEQENWGHKYVIARDVPGAGGQKQFASVSNSRAIFDLIDATPVGQRHFYEVLREDGLHLLYFDVEWEEKMHADAPMPQEADFLNAIVESLGKFMLEHYGVVALRKDFLVSTAARPGKLSYHITLPYLVPNEAARKEFKAQLRWARDKARVEQEDIIWRKGCPDSEVYGHEQLFRMLGCSGVGKPVALRPVVAEGWCRWPASSFDRFLESLLQADHPDFSLLPGLPTPLLPLPHRRREARVSGGDDVNGLPGLYKRQAIESQCLAMLRARGDSTSTVGFWDSPDSIYMRKNKQALI